MTWMIGIDEAGYGPNLGPLCVAATAWKAEPNDESVQQKKGFQSAIATCTKVDLYQRLSGVVCQVPDGERIAIADSKQLYKPGGSLRHLERGVLPVLHEIGNDSTDWNNFIQYTKADKELLRNKIPWYQNFNCDLPIDADINEIKTLANTWAVGCEESNIELLDIRSRMVFPLEFNQLTEYYGTKGAALSHISIGLLKDVLKFLDPCSQDLGPILITCDKHGGRNRYLALLQHHFPDGWIEMLEESRSLSRYRFGKNEICFRTKAEAELPVALASMTAKYQRELAMRAFNQFWGNKIAGLRPTAGYPGDAKRFKTDIASIQSKLGIDDALLWRKR